MLIFPKALAASLSDPELVLLDSTLVLPGAGRDPRTEYTAAHLPGARFLDLPGLHDSGGGLPGRVPDGPRFAAWLRQRGVGPDSRVSLYDDSPLRTACRAWFLFHLFGLSHAAILDGGLAVWRGHGLPLEGGAPAIAEAAALPPLDADRRLLRDKGEMVANLTTHADQVVDARDADRFTGRARDHVHDLPGGHIPGSRNLPFQQVLRADGTFLDPPEIRARFVAAGIDPERPVVATCGSGITACVLYVALKLIGAPRVALYDASWAEWGADPVLPKETGEAV